MAEQRRRHDEPVRLAVAGVGSMGANHARVLSSLKGVSLVGVFDVDRSRAQGVADRYETEVIPSLDDAMSWADGVVVAVPSVLHRAVAEPLLREGMHCLIEKPLATSVEDGEALVDAARAGGARILVGHIERFNPAVAQLREIVRDEPVLAVDARRMSAVSARVTDVDVIGDLLVHDLDIVCDLIDGEVSGISSRGLTDESGEIAYVTTMVTFDTGTLATLTASRITQNQIRELQVTTADRFFEVDYSAQELHIYRQGRIGGIGETEALADGRYVLDVGTERVFVRRVEPLNAELAHFVEVVRGRADSVVDGERALGTLRLLDRVRAEAGDTGA